MNDNILEQFSIEIAQEFDLRPLDCQWDRLEQSRQSEIEWQERLEAVMDAAEADTEELRAKTAEKWEKLRLKAEAADAKRMKKAKA